MIVSEVMNRDVKSITNQSTIAKALSLMEREHINELPVMSGGKVKGLITYHAIITNPNQSINSRVSRLMFKPPLVSEDDDLFDVIRLMSDSGVEGLPVINNGLLTGFISDYDIIMALKGMLKGLTVNDLMTDLPPKLKPSDNIITARRLLYYSKSNTLPVVNNKDELINTLTERDLMQFIKPVESMGYGMAEGNLINHSKVKISQLALSNHKLLIGTDLIKAIDYLLSNHLKSVILINDKLEPISVLNRFDIVRYLSKTNKPRGVKLLFSGLKLDYSNNSIITKAISDYLNKLSYLASDIDEIRVRIKPLHYGEGVRKFELSLTIKQASNKTHRFKKNGYLIKQLIDDALSDAEKIMRKEYKKNNP